MLLVVCGVLGLYASRQRALHRVPSFTCLLNPGEAVGRRWQPGVAQYAGDRLLWWRSLSLAPRPAAPWRRVELVLVDRTPMGQTDEEGRPLFLVDCRHGAQAFQMMLSAPAHAGLVSWLESAPRHVRRAL